MSKSAERNRVQTVCMTGAENRRADFPVRCRGRDQIRRCVCRSRCGRPSLMQSKKVQNGSPENRVKIRVRPSKGLRCCLNLQRVGMESCVGPG